MLLDVLRITPCLPGAELTEILGDNQYKGTASVKLGPVKLSFAGEAELFDVDNDARKAKMRAKGSDKKGRGTANADVVFALSASEGGGTRINVRADLTLAGTIAQYGRASGLIDQMAQQIIAAFVENLEAEMAPDAARGDTSPLLNTRQASEKSAGLAINTAENAEILDPVNPATNTAGDNSISGLSLLFRALIAMIKGWVAAGKK